MIRATADGIPDYTALVETSINDPGPDYSVTFPKNDTPNTPTDYTFTFDNFWLQNSETVYGQKLMVAEAWQGNVDVTYTAVDYPTTANESIFQLGGDARLTEGNDFNVGTIPNNSGNYYETVGRGSFIYSNSNPTDLNPSTVKFDFDFSNLKYGYLPAGTLISFVDWGEGAEAGIFESGNTPWMEQVDYANETGGPQNQPAPTYTGNGVYELYGNTNVGGSGGDYVWMRTTRSLTSLSITATQGPGGGSLGFKIVAPVTGVPEPATMMLLAVGSLGVWVIRRRHDG